MDAVQLVDLVAHGSRGQHKLTDAVAVEAPLEVRVNGEPFAVIMRTPGDDESLAMGFLYGESVIDSDESVEAIHSWPGDQALKNRLNVVLTPEASAASAERLAERRQVAMTSACGLCGRLTIDTLSREGAALPISWTVSSSLIDSLPERLRAAQPVFADTGGLHGAGLFARDAALITAAEDVGRHNAVDKVIGRMLRQRRLPLSDLLLAVSGRASFEIVQKAVAAGIPLVAAVSAPSSLAIECADIGGLTLAGFVRNRQFNVYTHAGRIIEG
jgi:FdhD protein